MTRSVVARLRDMPAMIDATAGMVEGCDRAACKADIKLRLAVERCVEIVSEASRHVPEAEKALQPEIPWREIAVIGSDREPAAGSGPDLVPALAVGAMGEATDRVLARTGAVSRSGVKEA